MVDFLFQPNQWFFYPLLLLKKKYRGGKNFFFFVSVGFIILVRLRTSPLSEIKFARLVCVSSSLTQVQVQIPMGLKGKKWA